MPKKYYAYIPFVPGASTTELVNAVNTWARNVDTVIRINESDQRIIAAKKRRIVDEENLGVEKDKGLIRELQAEVKILEEKLERGPILRPEKRPVLITYGNNGLRQLAALDKNDYVLYIVGHCAPGSNTLRETQSHSTSQDALSAQDLIDRLKEDGLPLDILHIKLLSCYGAAPNGEQQPFSHGLWRALRGICTSLVEFKAYHEPVRITSFYKGPDPHKVYAKVALGEVLVMNDVASGGKLSAVGKTYTGRRCTWDKCLALVTNQCPACKAQFCPDHHKAHKKLPNCYHPI